MTMTSRAALAALLGSGSWLGVWPGPGLSPALAATCHMTVQGVTVIDDRDCVARGRAGDTRIAVGSDDAIRIRRSTMSGRFVVRRPAGGRPRRVMVSYGQVLTSTDSDAKTCWFNQRATLCMDP